MTEQQIKSLSDEALRAIVNSTNPNGKFADQWLTAKVELKRRSQEWRPRFNPDLDWPL